MAVFEPKWVLVSLRRGVCRLSVQYMSRQARQRNGNKPRSIFHSGTWTNMYLFIDNMRICNSSQSVISQWVHYVLVKMWRKVPTSVILTLESFVFLYVFDGVDTNINFSWRQSLLRHIYLFISANKRKRNTTLLPPQKNKVHNWPKGRRQDLFPDYPF